MDYEWDENKRQINLDEHKVDFAAAYEFEWETAVREERVSALGYIGDRLHRIIVTQRGDKWRVISLRKANPREEDFYATTQA